MLKKYQKEGKYGNWELVSQDKTVGGKNRPDAVWINHKEKKIIIEDYYTGGKRDILTASGPESLSHNAKGNNYINEPDIKKLVDQGYDFQYKVGWRPWFLSPEHLH